MLKSIIRLLDARIKLVTLYVQYHLNCRHITDNSGDIKLWLMLSIPYIVFAPEMCYLGHDEVDCKPLFKNQVRKHCIFCITWIVGILLTVGVILNFEWCYQFTTSFLHLKCVILITMKLIVSLFSKIKLENIVYSISPELSAYYWQLGWY